MTIGPFFDLHFPVIDGGGTKNERVTKVVLKGNSDTNPKKGDKSPGF